MATLAAATVASTTPTHADGEGTPLSDLTLEQLLATDVSTASFVLEDFGDQPVSMTLITRFEIEASGARTLSELLAALVPGYFLVEDQDDTIAAFRGFAPDNNSKVLFQLDGHSLNTEWFFGPPDALLNGIDLSWIERIEVIRGPGSVTLGQGALLGVINVITRRGIDEPSARVGGAFGTDQLAAGSLAAGFREGDLSAAFYGSQTHFGGSPLRDLGWAQSQENPPGLSVQGRGHRLKAADQQLVLADLAWKEISLQALHVTQARDNYNFYRDREVIEQRLLALTVTWKHALDRSELLMRAGYARDEHGQRSLEGESMAGTREDRVDALAVFSTAKLAGADRLAVGIELEHVEMGLPDQAGQNLIVNESLGRAEATNESHTFVEHDRSGGGALFAEYALRVGRVTGFAGLRFDLHEQWGRAWSPRLGALVRASDALQVRLGLHSGFRGAVGVHYAGGFRRDGLLAEESFDAIDDNAALAALGHGDLATTRPERLTSLELGGRYRRGDALEIDGVVFLNRVSRVIDVGVIFVGDQLDGAPSEQRMIGDDVIGDWGGWFFFKNNPGTITSGGTELAVRWRGHGVDIRASHAAAMILDLDRADDQIGSMYVAGTADDPHFRAYPENIFRLAARARPLTDWWIAGTAVAFSRWFAPAGGAAGAAGGWVDAATGFELGDHVTTTLTFKNLTGARGLWPMNSNAGDPSVSPGTPALEPRSVWITVSVSR